jgi:hypothetical protein
MYSAMTGSANNTVSMIQHGWWAVQAKGTTRRREPSYTSQIRARPSSLRKTIMYVFIHMGWKDIRMK